MRESKYPEVAKTLGQKIRKKRMDLKITLLEVAKKVDISESYLSRIESDLQIPNPDVASKLALALDEDVNEYLSLSLGKFTYEPPNPVKSEDIFEIERSLKKLTKEESERIKKYITFYVMKSKPNQKKK